MRENLFKIYKDTKEFREIPGSLLGRAARGLIRAAKSTIGADGLLFKHKDADNKVDYAVHKMSYGSFRMDVYRPDGTLEEEQFLTPSHHSLTVLYYDANGRNVRNKDIFFTQGPELLIRERWTHTAGGAAEETFTTYTQTDGETHRASENAYYPGTIDRLRGTTFDSTDQPIYIVHYGQDQKITKKEYFHKESHAIKCIEEYENDLLVRQSRYRVDGTLEKTVEIEGRKSIETRYGEDGKTMQLRREMRDNEIQRDTEYHPTDPPRPQQITLFQNGYPYEKRQFDEDGNQTGQHSLDTNTGQYTSSRYKEEPGETEYTYNSDGKLKSSEFRRPPFATEAIGAKQVFEEYHPDGKTPSRRVTYDDAEMPVSEQAFYPDRKDKSTIGFDEEGHPKSKVTYGRDGETPLQERSYAKGIKTAETLHYVPDAEIMKIDKAFYLSGQVKREVVSYKDGRTSELDYYDMKPGRLAQEVLLSQSGDILVRRLYDKSGNLKDSDLNINASDKWKNRLDAQKAKRPPTARERE